MRKLLLQVQISVDGFVAGPNGEMDWMTWNWDDKIKEYVNGLHTSIDTILLGRKMAGGFIAHWAGVIDPGDPSCAFAKLMTGTPKVVFTKTLERSEWDNTVLAKGALEEEINALKNKNGNDIIVYGGAGFVSSLIAAGLIDDLHLFVNPAAIGNGMAIFKGLTAIQNFELAKAIPFECGIVVHHYRLK